MSLLSEWVLPYSKRKRVIPFMHFVSFRSEDIVQWKVRMAPAMIPMLSVKRKYGKG